MRRLLPALIALILIGCSDGTVQVDPNAMTAPLSAEQHAAEIEQAKATTPLPDGVGWQRIEIDPSGTYGFYGGASMVECQAACAWFAEALAADAAGERSRRDAAHDVIRQIPTWRSFSDPAMTDPSFRDFIAGVAEHALRSEPKPVNDFIVANCI